MAGVGTNSFGGVSAPSVPSAGVLPNVKINLSANGAPASSPAAAGPVVATPITVVPAFDVREQLNPRLPGQIDMGSIADYFETGLAFAPVVSQAPVVSPATPAVAGATPAAPADTPTPVVDLGDAPIVPKLQLRVDGSVGGAWTPPQDAPASPTTTAATPFDSYRARLAQLEMRNDALAVKNPDRVAGIQDTLISAREKLSKVENYFVHNKAAIDDATSIENLQYNNLLNELDTSIRSANSALAPVSSEDSRAAREIRTADTTTLRDTLKYLREQTNPREDGNQLQKQEYEQRATKLLNNLESWKSGLARGDMTPEEYETASAAAPTLASQIETLNADIRRFGATRERRTLGSARIDGKGGTDIDWTGVASLVGIISPLILYPLQRAQAKQDADDNFDRQKELLALQNEYEIQQIAARGDASVATAEASRGSSYKLRPTNIGSLGGNGVAVR